MTRGLALTLCALLAACAPQRAPVPVQPVIDVHLHALETDADWASDPPAWFPKDLAPATTDAMEQELTLEALRRHHVEKAVLSGHGNLPAAWKAADPARFVLSKFLWDPQVDKDSLAELEAGIRSGQFAAIGEVCAQYQGKTPDELEPLFALAERLDVPVSVHMGLGPREGAAGPEYKMANGRPLLFEGVLARHPKLRLQVMHAGWPFLDEMVALLWLYPEVYVDVAVIDWYIPREEFHAYLKRLVEAGFGKRIMYGSDQMYFPGAIDRSIAAIESADFLSTDQKRDILHDNAARFYRLEPRTPG